MKTVRHKSGGFTLIEVMVVVAIMAVIMTMGLPPLLQSIRKDSVRKAATDLAEVCGFARARAIMSATTTTVVFHPQERRFEVGGAGGTDGTPAGAGLAGQLPEDIKLELLFVNFQNYLAEETSTVRFFPNGTSDDLRVVLVSDKGERRGVVLEVTTGVAEIETDMNRVQHP